MNVHPKGLKGPELAHKRARFRAMAPLPKISMPDILDYSDLFGPVQDQGLIGCCVAEATLGIFESKLHKHLNASVLASRRALYGMTQRLYETMDAGQDVGMFPSDALTTLRDHGYLDAIAWPEHMAFGPDYFAAPAGDLVRRNHLLNGFVYVGGTNGESSSDLVDHLQRALVAHGPVCIGLEWAQVWEDPIDGTLNPNPDETDRAGGHEVTLVGYDHRRQAFKIRNSWGPKWSLGGYVWMPFGTAYSRLPWDAFAIEADR